MIACASCERQRGGHEVGQDDRVVGDLVDQLLGGVEWRGTQGSRGKRDVATDITP